MDFQLNKLVEENVDDLNINIKQLLKQFDITHTLTTYIDKLFWDSKIQAKFSPDTFENLTDFNYSKCFSYHINLTEPNFFICGRNSEKFIELHGLLFRLEILISIVRPYFFYRFFCYYLESGKVNLKSSAIPYQESHQKYVRLVYELCIENGFKTISEENLVGKIPGIDLELAKENSSVYNLFFNDGYSSFPY